MTVIKSEDTVAKYEARAIEKLSSALENHLEFSRTIYNLIKEVLSEVAKQEEAASRALQVCACLLVRMLNDLRSIMLLTERGYPLQAVSLLTTLYEVSFAIAYVGNDDEHAQQWVNHADPKKSLSEVKKLTEDVFRKEGFEDPKAMVERYYKVFRQVSLAKHANPLLQKNFGFIVQEKKMLVISGPELSSDAMRASWFALEHACKISYLALLTFVKSYVSDTLYKKFHESLLGIDSRGAELNEMAVKKYGSQDPFSGKW